MNPFPSDPRLSGRFRELRAYPTNAGAGTGPSTRRGFVCILDLRRARHEWESWTLGRFIAWAVLIALAVVVVTTCV